MVVISKNDIKAPFLSTPLKFIGGLDPMGLLNVGERTYSMLLPGLNSITDRIRYYSFYCWFFGLYAKIIGDENPKIQRTYLRRAEYMLALVAAKLKLIGIPGITEAERNHNKQLPVYSLKEGTGEDKDTFENTYWQNPRGVFGQNYVSSMRQMGLIRDKGFDTGLYIRTAFEKEGIITGKQLELAFDDNLSDLSKRIFIEALKKGEITDNDLSSICDDFNMRNIKSGSLESSLLIKMLTGVDLPLDTRETYYRRDTGIIYLNLVQKKGSGVSVMDMMKYAYDNQGKIDGETNETLMAWYYYQVDQLWHMISTGCLSAFLLGLKEKSGGSWLIESQLIEELAHEISNSMISGNIAKPGASFIQLPVFDEDGVDMANRARSQNYINAFKLHFILLRKIIDQNSHNVNLLIDYAKYHDLRSTSNFIAAYDDLIDKSNLSIADFSKYFIKKYVVNRHQFVALRKMNDTQSTEKFLREDGLIRFIDTIEYEFSGQRLGSLIQFFEDLGILNRTKDRLSPVGIRLLENYSF